MAAQSTEAGPLAGVRVLDMSRLLPGPFCEFEARQRGRCSLFTALTARPPAARSAGSQLLCDMGAEVIKIEDFNGGDYVRSYPPAMSDGNSAIFHALNRGKKSVQLDLKNKDDHAAFMKLLGTADILLETFRPGVMKKLGLSPPSLLQRFPSLIVCSISGYGQTGPDSLRAGHDVNYVAKSGAFGTMPEPKLLPLQVADIAGGSYPAAVQILAALRQKEKTGKGAIIGQWNCEFRCVFG
jgi:crotonobetainyl-CoA:carnitine CoA-transferase CaiB-like acyl-CoA transferase